MLSATKLSRRRRKAIRKAKNRYRPSRNQSAVQYESLEERRLLAVGLDTSFGDNGIVRTNLVTEPTYDQARDVIATQADGKILVTGDGGTADFLVTRYNIDGSLDMTFGSEGKAAIDFPGNAEANGMTLDGGGKIILVGSIYSNGYDFAATRLNSDGSVDASFGTDGLATVDFGSTNDRGYSVDIDGNGKIVLGGRTLYNGNWDFAAARLNADGSLDTSFSVDGRATLDLGSNSSDYANDVTVDSAGRILIAGSSDHESYYRDFALVRFNNDGSLDNSFDGDGKLTTDFADDTDEARSIVVDSSGRIVVVGYADQGYPNLSDFAIARYLPNGSLDTSFGSGGKVTIDFANNSDYAFDIAIAADGDLVVAGRTNSGYPTYYDFGVVRLNADGTLDSGFGGDGKVSTNVSDNGNYSETAFGVDIDSQGRVVVAGTGYSNTTNYDFAVVRYNSNGNLDGSFGDNGIVYTDVGRGTYEQAEDVVVLQPDGKILALANKSLTRELAVVRYNVDGTLDTSFGTDGIAAHGYGANGESGYVRDMTVDSNGDILIVGRVQPNEVAVYRLNSDGSLDNAFDGDGRVSFDFGPGSDYFSSVTVDGSGKIIVAGYSYQPGTSSDFAVARINNNGTLDTTFDGDGKTTIDFGDTSDFVLDIAIDSNGRIVVGGLSRQGNDSDFAVARLKVDGSLDISFDGDGRALIDSGSNRESGEGVVVDANDNVIIVGEVDRGGGDWDMAIVRLDHNGALDSSFDGDGIVLTDINGAYDGGYDISIDSAGRYVVGGETEIGDRYDFALARYNTDGSLDTSFDGDGVLTTDTGGEWAGIWRLAIDPAGRIVVGGWESSGDIILARYATNTPPTATNAVYELAENSLNGTSVGIVPANDPNGDDLTYSVLGGSGTSVFDLDANSGEITVADESQLDYETTTSFSLEVQVDDGNGGSDTATITINLLNQASITGSVFVDVNQNGEYDANEPGIDGVVVELFDENGAPTGVTTTTSDGGIYLFEDLDPGTYQVHQVQPEGVDDGNEVLGTTDDPNFDPQTVSIVDNHTMQLTLERYDAYDFAFAELGQAVTSGDTATIGFWQNKHGQNLIKEGGTALATWLTDNFGNVFGDAFDLDGNDDGQEVADFYKRELFKRKSNHSAGPAKVDAQFMGTALATYFTSSIYSGGNVASSYGFNVTDTGIGTNTVNVGSAGDAFAVDDDSNLTIMQLLLATNQMTVSDGDGATDIYDLDGDGDIDADEASLRAMANSIYSMINELGDI